MTVSPTRPAAIPSPRTAEPDVTAGPESPREGRREQPAVRYPWPEPWRPGGGTRPRTEYWDVWTAGWRAGSPAPHPRSED